MTTWPGALRFAGTASLPSAVTSSQISLHLLQLEAYQRRHRAVTRRHGLLHQASALAHGAHRVGKLESTGRDQRAVFAKAMTRRDFGFAADFLAIDAQRRNRSGHDRGLSVGSQPQFLFRAFEA